MKIGDYKQMMAYLTRPEQPKEQVADLADDLTPGPLKDELKKDFDPSQETHEEYLQRKALGERPFNAQDGGRANLAIGGGAIEGEELGTREGFAKPGPKSSGDIEGALEYLKTLKPGTPVNTYAVGKQFNVAPATVRGQVKRNFPELKLQTKEDSARIAAETRKEIYKQKQSDVPVVETKIRGKGVAARGKGRDITGIRFPSEEMKNDYIKDIKEKYSDVRYRKGLTNKELAEKYLGSSNPNDIGRIERINNFFVKDLNLEYKKAPVSEIKEKRTRRLAITQGGKYLKGTEDIPFHHIMPIGGEVDLTTKDAAFITKEMNSKLAPYNTKLNDIADAISNQLNNQEPGYLKRIDELNNEAEKIIESVKTRLPKKYQNYIGFNRLDPILDENATPIRLNVTRVGVDDSKSLAGKTGEAVKLGGLTQRNIDEIKKLKYRDAIKNFPISTGGPTLGANLGLLKGIGETLPYFGTPLGAAVLTGGFGLDPKDAMQRVGIEAELALAPELVKQTSKLVKNPFFQRALNLGLSPTAAMRAARIASPLGIASLGGEALYKYGKFVKDELGRIEQMSPEEREAYNIAEQEQMGVAAADGGLIRQGFADGPEDPGKRKFMKIMGGLASLPIFGKLLKPAAKVVEAGAPVAEKAATEAEKLFFKLVDAVKSKGIMDKLDRVTGGRLSGAYHEYKGAEVLEDAGSITAKFRTDKGAPAEIVYIKPQKRIDPKTGKEVEYPGEFDYEAQEIGRINPEGDVDIDADFEITDSLEDVKKLIDD